MTRTFYSRLLGARFEILPTVIRDMHTSCTKAAGRAKLTRGTSPLARLICTMARMPQSGDDVSVETVFEPIENGERWTRTFNGQSFQTDLVRSGDAPGDQLTERFGPFSFRLRITAHEHGVDLMPEGVSLFGVMPLPRMFCPEAIGLERMRDGRYYFDVSVRFPLAGDVMHYEGWLEPVA